MRVPVNIGCILGNPATLKRVATAVETHGGRAIALAQSEIVGAVTDGTIHALIYDLEPGDSLAAETVRTVRRLRPHLPIWLHYPLRPTTAALAAEFAWLPGILGTPQLSGEIEQTEVRSYVVALLSAVPRVRLERLVRTLVGSAPPAVLLFVEASLDRLTRAGFRPLKVEEIAADAGLGLRWLEHLCQASSLAHPKRLLHHLTLVWVTFMTWSGAALLTPSGRQLGWNSKDLARIRKQVLGTTERWHHLWPLDQFVLAAIALGRACNLSAPAARDTVETFVLESVG